VVVMVLVVVRIARGAGEEEEEGKGEAISVESLAESPSSISIVRFLLPRGEAGTTRS
jgi:hypothetical protein